MLFSFWKPITNNFRLLKYTLPVEMLNRNSHNCTSDYRKKKIKSVFDNYLCTLSNKTINKIPDIFPKLSIQTQWDKLNFSGHLKREEHFNKILFLQFNFRRRDLIKTSEVFLISFITRVGGDKSLFNYIYLHFQKK